MNFWFYIGIGLILWGIYDIYYGVTWAFRPIYKRYQPNAYWFVTLLWIVVAIYTTLSGLGLV